MLSALRSTLEDPCGAATTSGAAQEPSAPVMPQLLPAGASASGSVWELGTAYVAAVPVRVRHVRVGAWRGRHAPWHVAVGFCNYLLVLGSYSEPLRVVSK